MQAIFSFELWWQQQFGSCFNLLQRSSPGKAIFSGARDPASGLLWRLYWFGEKLPTLWTALLPAAVKDQKKQLGAAALMWRWDT